MTGPTAPIGALTFSPAQLALARDNQTREPIADAIAYLDSPGDDPVTEAYLAASRYLLRDDTEAGHEAAELLENIEVTAAATMVQDSSQALLAWLSAAALLRHHPAWPKLQSARPMALAAEFAYMKHATDPLDKLWHGALNMAVGILLNRETRRQYSADVYRGAIDHIIHPEGFLKGIVDVEDAENTFASQVSGTCALALAAEMAPRADIDLWSYNDRGVTPATAATYLLYYYFYPEQWRWSDGLNRVDTEAVMRREGAFIEIVNLRSPLREVELLMAELRPLFCAYGGGLTTLTHSIRSPRKRRWRWL